MHEALIRVFKTARPQKDTLALIELEIVTTDTIKAMPNFLIVAKTVTNWHMKTNSALVQVCNPSDRSITIQSKTVLGTISPVITIPENVASAVANNRLESPQARIDLATALDELFKRSTFNDHQQVHLLDLCTKYSFIFSLSLKELGKCTIAEAEFPLQEQAKPVDHHPYRTNPRAQEVIDKCVENIQSDGIIE